MEVRHALALDIGGSHATAAVVDLSRRLVMPETLARSDIDSEGPAEELLDAWASLVAQALDHANRPPVTHLGVAMPGPFDYESGVSLLRHKFAALYSRNVGEGLRARLGEMPIRFGNDATLFTLGEAWAGSARGYERVLGVTLGTGLGSGFVVGGQIVSEGDPAARNDLWCASYLDRTAEEFVSGRGIQAEHQARTGTPLDAQTVAARAHDGDEAAREAYQAFGAHLGTVLRPSLAALRPDCLVVGGNIARAWPLFHPALRKALGEDTPALVPTELFESASLLGAAALGANPA